MNQGFTMRAGLRPGTDELALQRVSEYCAQYGISLSAQHTRGQVLLHFYNTGDGDAYDRLRGYVEAVYDRTSGQS